MAQAFAVKEENNYPSAVDQFRREAFLEASGITERYEQLPIPENMQAPLEHSCCPEPVEAPLPLSSKRVWLLNGVTFCCKSNFISPRPCNVIPPRQRQENIFKHESAGRGVILQRKKAFGLETCVEDCNHQAFPKIFDCLFKVYPPRSENINLLSNNAPHCTIPPIDPGLVEDDHNREPGLDESDVFKMWLHATRCSPKRVLLYSVSRKDKIIRSDRCAVGWKIKYYFMNPGRSKVKRKKIHTEKGQCTKKFEEGDITEVISEAYSIFEGPAEIPLMQPPTNLRKGRHCRREPTDVVADGIISDMASDPPGQQTKYIGPGDTRREAYRLSTFEQFPNKAVQTAILAKHGFVYTGFVDRVKCFSCARTIESWANSDNPADRKWHKNDCPFANGLPSGNVPLGGLFSSAVGNLMNSNAPQPMDQSTSSSQSGNRTSGQIPNDIPDLQRGGQNFGIGTGSQSQPVVTRPPARNPPRQWRMANVISADHKRHLTNLYLNREIDRLASFGRWPTGRPNVAPVTLARAGFFYLGDMDRTQCFSCGGVLRNWSAADIAMDEHRTHFPNCRLVVGVERRNVPIPNEPETPQELAEKYPCRFPMNPHMRSEASRVEAFDRRWPVGRTRAQPQEIAEAGFFFLGERDRVKCWYCNGGLQNWEYDDIPWIEHAKWFPNCQFLLATKGQLFVHQYLSNCPHLPRPIIARQDGALVDTSTATLHSSAPSASGLSSSSGRDVPPPSATRVRAPSPPPAIIDPQEEQRKRMERVDKEMDEGEAVKLVKAMGYEEDLIRKTLVDKLESGTPHDAENIFEGTAALLDAVMQKEEEAKQEQEAEQAPASISFPTIPSNYSSFQMESMDTSASLGHTSGLHQVSGFHIDSDDEDRDLYGGGASGMSSNQPIGYAGGATFAPPSLDEETTVKSSLWEDVPSDPESMKEFIEQKKEEQLCKICFTEPADMVFLPCSHMACCLTCTQALRTCPVCRTKIEKAIKTYRK